MFDHGEPWRIFGEQSSVHDCTQALPEGLPGAKFLDCPPREIEGHLETLRREAHLMKGGAASLAAYELSEGGSKARGIGTGIGRSLQCRCHFGRYWL